MKYKVGDRVKIVSEKPEGLGWTDEMNEWLGKPVTITGFRCNGTYKIEEDGSTWAWYDDMIAGLAEPELTANEMLQIMRELTHNFICDFLRYWHTCSKEDLLLNVATPQQVIEMCQRWKSEHKKKEPEIETVDICRIIEIFPDGRKRCVHEEDIKPDPELPYGSEQLAAEEMLKSYCMEHEGEFIAVHEVVSRVRAVK